MKFHERPRDHLKSSSFGVAATLLLIVRHSNSNVSQTRTAHELVVELKFFVQHREASDTQVGDGISLETEWCSWQDSTASDTLWRIWQMKKGFLSESAC